MRARPYLCFHGQELANDGRTLSYIRYGFLNDSRYQVSLIDPRIPEGGYIDTYEDTYQCDPGCTQNLSCFCRDYMDDSYGTPSGDPADWFVATQAHSADYLGIVADEVRVEEVVGRSVNPRADRGARIGRLRPRHRVISVQGTMYAATERGMAWGERWVADVLSGAFCEDGCAVDGLEILPACTEGTDGSGFRTLRNVGIIDGPEFRPITNNVPECVSQEVFFQLAAGLPWLYGPEEAVLDGETVDSGSSPTCAIVTTEEWPGDKGVRVELTAPDSQTATNIVVRAHVTYDLNCVEQEINECARYEIATLEAGATLVIDGSEESAYIEDPTTKQKVTALPFISWDGLFPWITVPPCTSICICIEVGGGAVSANVSAFPREL